MRDISSLSGETDSASAIGVVSTPFAYFVVAHPTLDMAVLVRLLQMMTNIDRSGPLQSS